MTHNLPLVWILFAQVSEISISLSFQLYPHWCILSEAVAGSTLNDCGNPIFTEKLDKTELPLGTFECSPCARGKMLVLCVGEEGQEKVNAFCLIFEIYFSLYSGSCLCRNFIITKEIYTSTGIPNFPCNSVEFQLT